MLCTRSPAEDSEGGRNTDFNILVHLLHPKLFEGTPARNQAVYLCGKRGRAAGNTGVMTVLKSTVLFVLAAMAEIGGAWLIWQAVREGKAWWWAGLGVIALGIYGFFAAFQPEAHFGRVLAAYGGVFIAGSLAWGMLVDGFRPDRWDVIGAAVCVVGVGIIMFAPRPGG
ncbi:drug/metabolite transporter superfamily protein YnfA [Paenarthrobacter sp. TE4293]